MTHPGFAEAWEALERVLPPYSMFWGINNAHGGGYSVTVDFAIQPGAAVERIERHHPDMATALNKVRARVIELINETGRDPSLADPTGHHGDDDGSTVDHFEGE